MLTWRNVYRSSILSFAVIAGAQLPGMCHAQTTQPPQSSASSSSQKTVAEEKLAQLQAHAERMHEHDRGRIYSDIARELAEIANQQFAEGHPEQAQGSIKDGVSYAEKAAAAAQQRGKKIKDTEINLREYARRLEEILRSVTPDEQPPIKQAVTRIDQLRKELLDQMFRKN